MNFIQFRESANCILTLSKKRGNEVCHQPVKLTLNKIPTLHSRPFSVDVRGGGQTEKERGDNPRKKEINKEKGEMRKRKDKKYKGTDNHVK